MAFTGLGFLLVAGCFFGFISNLKYDKNFCGENLQSKFDDKKFFFKCVLPSTQDFDFTQLPGNKTNGIEFKCTSESVSYFEPGSLSHFPRVNKLIIDKCNLEKLDTDTFKELPSMKTLLIDLPRLRKKHLVIPPGFFNGNNLLEFIQITSGNILQVPSDLFCNLKYLTEINLSRNLFKELGEIGCGVNNSRCPQLKVLRLQSNRVNRVRKKDFQFFNLSILDLSRNNISVIETGAFDSNFNLVSVNLMDNKLSQLEEGLFKKNINLKEINLSLNSIRTLPSNILHALTSVTILFLRSNKIKSLDRTVFSNTTSLEYLDLSVNNIRVLPRKIWENTSSLTTLLLTRNNLTRIQEKDFQSLHQLKTLNLARNNIGQISSSALMLLNQLMEIDLSYNKLTKIPNFPSNLTVIYLTGNKIGEIHETAFEGLKNLVALSLSENQIEFIPQSPFKNLPNIQRVDFRYNFIRRVENWTFSYSSSLKYLNLAHNNIKEMNNLFNKVSQYLDLSDNSLTKFDFFDISEQLEELDLSYNKIDIIANPRGEQSGYKLKRFHINNNQLQVFVGLYFPPKIEYIDMKNNNISKFMSLSTSRLPNLMMLNLYNNRIKEIEFEEVQYNSPILPDQVITEIILDGNPLICSCENVWMKSTRSTMYRYVPKITGFFQCLPVNKRHLASNNLVLVDVVPEKDFVCEYDGIRDRDDVTQVCPKAYSRIDKNGGKLCSCYREFHGSQNIIDCGNVSWTANVVSDVVYPFPSRATVLFLDNNRNVNGIVDRLVTNFTHLKELYLNSSKLRSIDQRLLAKCSTISSLFLNTNKIREIKKGDFDKTPNLHKLYLHENKISFIEEAAFVVLNFLKELTLHQNHLQRLLLWEMGTYTLSISLSRNLLICDCNYTSTFHKWISSNQFFQISDLDDVKCYKLKIPIMDFNDSTCFPFTSENNYHLTMILSITFSLVILLVIFIVVIYLYRLEMQVLLYSHYGIRIFHRKEDADVGKTYDAFVSYSNEDDEWVIEEFIGKLSEYQLCLHQRDFPVGGLIIDSIVNAVENSCRTLLILTPSFLESDWCMFEFKSAHLQCLQDRCKRLIVIILDEDVKSRVEDKELQAYLKTNTYLEWKDKLFWEKLKFAMPDLKRRS